MLPLEKFAKVKNKICLYYKGSSIDMISYLNNLNLKKEFPEIELWISYKKCFHKNENNFIPLEEINNYKKEFGFIKEIKLDPKLGIEESIKYQIFNQN